MDVELIREPYELAYAIDPLAAVKVLWAYRKGEIDSEAAVRSFRTICFSSPDDTNRPEDASALC